MRPGPSAQFGERLELRLEAGHPAQACVHQQPVRRIAIDRVGADVHHIDRRPPIGRVGGGDIAVEGGGQQVEDLPSKLRGPGVVGGRVGCVAQRSVNGFGRCSSGGSLIRSTYRRLWTTRDHTGVGGAAADECPSRPGVAFRRVLCRSKQEF